MATIESVSTRELADGNALAARREYHRRFPNRRLPGRMIFVTIHRNLMEYGTFRRSRGQGRPQANYNLEEALTHFEEDPRVSIRTVSRISEIPRTIIGKMTQMQGLHAFHFQRVQDLLPGDFLRRVEFCQWIMANRNQIPNILWTDEATFTRNGAFNMHNSHFWATENPRAVRRTNFQHRFSINVWAAVIGDIFIGPVVLPTPLTSAAFLNFLETDLGPLLEDVPLHVRRNLIFQLDGAPAHYGRNVRAWLNTNFPQKWIGRDGPEPWPPRSPDLNPMDYHIWGHMNELVYAVEIETEEQLIARVNWAANEIRNNRFAVLRGTRSIVRRAQLCIQQNGNHFEQLL